ncbi:hypothetical protein MKX03_025553 [Papaver bracteatum]|nr:hypothetical protein MKX03_025553 [Papaver bracteatum]
MEEQNGHAVKDEFPSWVPSSFKFIWRIRNVSELNQDNHFSPTFTTGPFKWQLAAFRKGSNADDYVSVYVVAVDCTNSRYTKCSLAVVGDQTSNTFKKEGRMVHFTKEENNWGFDEFIRFNELTDPSNGYTVNDACTVEVELCSFSEQDYIKELVPGGSGRSDMRFVHEETENGKKLAKENSSAVQRSNWDENGGGPESSESRIDGQPIPHVSTAVPVTPKPSPLVSAAVSVTPKTLKESDGYRKYSISEIKEKYHLDERFEVEFIEGEDRLTDALVKSFPCDKDNLLIAVGQLEAGLRLPLYYQENPFYYEVLSQRADKRAIFQYNGNFFRFLRECRKRSKGCTGITSKVSKFRREDYTATNFNCTWADNTTGRNRFPWCVGPRRISYSQDQDLSGKAELLPEYKGKKRFGMVRLDHDEKWFRTPLRIKGPWVMGWLTSGDPRTSFEKFYPPYEPWTLNMEVTSATVPDDTDGTDTDGDDPAWTTPLVHLKRKPALGDQNVEDTSVKRSCPDRLDVQSSSKNSEDLEIPNVVDAPFVNSGVLDADARDEFRSTTMGLADTEAFFQEFAQESTFLSVAKFVEHCPKLYDLYLLYRNKSKDLEREKDLLVSEVHDLKSRMQGLVTREEADAALAKQIEATNSSVQEHLALANARIQELESLNHAQSLQLATRAERAQEIIKLAEGL